MKLPTGKRLVRRAAMTAAALAASVFLTVAFPLLNHLLHGDGKGKAGPRVVAQVSVKSQEAARPLEQPRRQLKQPRRSKPMQAPVKAGPRFAMDLGVGGLEGAAAPIDIVNRPSGGGGEAAGEDGDVDEKPSPTAPPPFRMPSEVKAAERDAYAVLSFCVDASGRPYEIRVAEEKPAGLGMGQAAREALRQTAFTPARKGGLAVAFCGLEQLFEVRFSN